MKFYFIISTMHPKIGAAREEDVEEGIWGAFASYTNKYAKGSVAQVRAGIFRPLASRKHASTRVCKRSK